MTILVELVRNEGGSVRFRYVIDPSAELVLSKDWWEDLGRPERLDVTLEPDAQE